MTCKHNTAKNTEKQKGKDKTHIQKKTKNKKEQ